MKHILLLVVLCMMALSVNAGRIFVKQGESGTGASWTDASGDLYLALSKARPYDEIWVARGIYYPTTDNNRQKFFLIPENVKVYGGFAGNETLIQQRNFLSNKTVLSGNIGSRNSHLDNSFTIVVFAQANEHTVLDGFIIADGNADGSGATADMDRCGGGMYIDGSAKGGQSNPVIQNCIFQNNYARDGGAIYVNARGGICHPTFINCEFLGNKAELDGGAIFNDGRHGGQANPTFSGCIFQQNLGNYGGAICNFGGKGESNPIFHRCIFRNNEANLRGGAIFNMDIEGVVMPVINDCQFVNNSAVAGRGVYTFSKPVKEEEENKTSDKSN